MADVLHLHASCAARDSEGVLLLGPSGSGKSDLLLRLMDRGFRLVADDRVEVEGGVARAPEALAGLIEVRGLGLMRCAFEASARLVLAVSLEPGLRMPAPARYDVLDLPLICMEAFAASAALRVGLALDGLRGTAAFVAGAFG